MNLDVEDGQVQSAKDQPASLCVNDELRQNIKGVLAASK